jgi:hypothetical protein
MSEPSTSPGVETKKGAGKPLKKSRAAWRSQGGKPTRSLPATLMRARRCCAVDTHRFFGTINHFSLCMSLTWQVPPDPHLLSFKPRCPPAGLSFRPGPFAQLTNAEPAIRRVSPGRLRNDFCRAPLDRGFAGPAPSAGEPHFLPTLGPASAGLFLAPLKPLPSPCACRGCYNYRTGFDCRARLLTSSLYRRTPRKLSFREQRPTTGALPTSNFQESRRRCRRSVNPTGLP